MEALINNNNKIIINKSNNNNNNNNNNKIIINKISNTIIIINKNILNIKSSRINGTNSGSKIYFTVRKNLKSLNSNLSNNINNNIKTISNISQKRVFLMITLKNIFKYFGGNNNIKMLVKKINLFNFINKNLIGYSVNFFYFPCLFFLFIYFLDFFYHLRRRYYYK